MRFPSSLWFHVIAVECSKRKILISSGPGWMFLRFWRCAMQIKSQIGDSHWHYFGRNHLKYFVFLKTTSAPELRTPCLAWIFVMLCWGPYQALSTKARATPCLTSGTSQLGQMAISLLLSPKAETRIAGEIRLSSHGNREGMCPWAGTVFSHCHPLLLYPENGGWSVLGKVSNQSRNKCSNCQSCLRWKKLLACWCMQYGWVWLCVCMWRSYTGLWNVNAVSMDTAEQRPEGGAYRQTEANSALLMEPIGSNMTFTHNS